MSQVQPDAPPPYSALGSEYNTQYCGNYGAPVTNKETTYGYPGPPPPAYTISQMPIPQQPPPVVEIPMATDMTHGSCRFTCAHCAQVMVFKPSGIARCPYCRRISSAGRSAARNRAIIYAVVAAVFLAAGIGVTAGTYQHVARHGGYYFVWSGGFIVALVFFIYSIRYAVMKTSPPVSQQVQ